MLLEVTRARPPGERGSACYRGQDASSPSPSVGKTPYVRFDLNDSSVPHTHVRRQLVLIADTHTVRVVDGPTAVATHTRTWGRGEQIEDPVHTAALVAEKRAAHQHSSTNRLQHAAPHSRDFLMRAADRGQNLGSITYQLSRLLAQYGAELDVALAEANTRGIVHPPSWRQLLDQRRAELDRPAPLTAEVPQAAPARRGRPPARPRALRRAAAAPRRGGRPMGTTDIELRKRALALGLRGLLACWD